MAVVDKKKSLSLKLLKTIPKGVPFVAFQRNGSLCLRKVYQKSVGERGEGNELRSNGKQEYLDDKETTIAAMHRFYVSVYEVQLVIIETENETLDTDEIKFLNLTKLKLMYPSITK
jgi:hypothetical protein